MEVNEDTLKRLEGLIGQLDEQVTKKEFVTTLEQVLELVLKIERRNSEAVDSMEQAFRGIVEHTQQSHETSLTDLKGQVDQVFVADRLKAIETSLTTLIREKIAAIRDGEDGKDGIPGAPGRPGRDGKDAVMTPALREELDAVKHDVEALQKRPTATGGGVTNMRIIQAFKYILKTEQPTGVIDGVNTTYTTKQPVFAILGMSINGETIAQLPNYTVKANSITFSSPLPADYSGKDFEIKYI